MSTQLSHEQSKFNRGKFRITLVCDGVRGAANVGSLFRIAEAFGVEELIFCRYRPETGRRMEKTARATQNRVLNRFEPDTEMVLDYLKQEGYTLIGLEITDRSIPLQELNLKEDAKIALLIGGEVHGIHPAALEKMDITAHIEMFGQNSSMNVSMATGICLFKLTQLLKKG